MTKKRASSTVYGIPEKKPRLDTLRHDTGDGYEIKARVDPVYGQQSAFPGLEERLEGNESPNNLFFGPAEDGLSYLQMVRAEASEVPSVLLASKPNETGQSTEREQEYQAENSASRSTDLTGFWSGEAIVAKTMTEDKSHIEYMDEYDEDEEAEEQDPQDAFYRALIARFIALRGLFSGKPRAPPEIHNNAGERTSGVDPAPLISLTASQSSWYRAFSYSKPTLAFVSSLGQSSVNVAIERLEVLLTKRNIRNPQRQHNLGIWAWSLLARCREVGQLSGEEISSLRSLARTALRLERTVRMGRADSASRTQGISVVDDSDNEERSEDTEENNDETVNSRNSANDAEEAKVTENEEQLVEARKRLLDMVESSHMASSEHLDPCLPGEVFPASMMLDSIVTIVGTLFGQRDLLGQRSAW